MFDFLGQVLTVMFLFLIFFFTMAQLMVKKEVLHIELIMV